MEVVYLKIDWEHLMQIIPEEYIKKSGITAQNYGKALVFSAQEGEISLGICVFFPHKGSQTTYELVYVLVEESRQREGIARELLLESKKHLASVDIRSIMTSFYDEDAPKTVPLLESVGFKKHRTHYMIAYTVGELMESKVGKELPSLHKQLSAIKNYMDVDERARTRFLAEIRAKKPWINTARIDREYSVFLTSAEQVIGFLDAERQDNEKIYIKGIHLLDSASPKAIPMLIAKLMEILSQNHSDNTLIGMEFENEKLGQAVIDTFGSPRELELLPVMWTELSEEND